MPSGYGICTCFACAPHPATKIQKVQTEARKSTMKEIVYFVLGAAVGATLALLFAPESGQELRANLQATAEKDAAKVQAEWQAAMAKTEERLDQMQAELKQTLQRAQK